MSLLPCKINRISIFIMGKFYKLLRIHHALPDKWDFPMCLLVPNYKNNLTKKRWQWPPSFHFHRTPFALLHCITDTNIRLINHNPLPGPNPTNFFNYFFKIHRILVAFRTRLREAKGLLNCTNGSMEPARATPHIRHYNLQC